MRPCLSVGISSQPKGGHRSTVGPYNKNPPKALIRFLAFCFKRGSALFSSRLLDEAPFRSLCAFLMAAAPLYRRSLQH